MQVAGHGSTVSSEVFTEVPPGAPCEPHLEISVDDAQVVQVLDGIQHLENEAAGVALRVEAFFYDAVKQLPT